MLARMVSLNSAASCATSAIDPRRLASVDVAHVLAVDAHGAGRDVVKARQQVEDGGFARARRADQRHRFAGRDREADVLQRRAFAIGEATHRRNATRPLVDRERLGAGLVVDLDRLVEQAEDARAARRRASLSTVLKLLSERAAGVATPTAPMMPSRSPTVMAPRGDAQARHIEHAGQRQPADRFPEAAHCGRGCGRACMAILRRSSNAAPARVGLALLKAVGFHEARGAEAFREQRGERAELHLRRFGLRARPLGDRSQRAGRRARTRASTTSGQHPVEPEHRGRPRRSRSARRGSWLAPPRTSAFADDVDVVGEARDQLARLFAGMAREIDAPSAWRTWRLADRAAP